MKESKTKFKACSICGVVHERIWYTENSSDSSTILCQSCYDEYYTFCCECDTLILREDAYYEGGSDEPLCHRRYEGSRSHDYIEDYYYKPEPIFYCEGGRFFGVF